MNARETYRLDSTSPVGRAMMLQAVSAVTNIGGITLLTIASVTQDSLTIVVIGSLYALAFVQINMVRYVLQKQRNGIEGSLVVAYAAVVLSVIVELLILTQGYNVRILYFGMLALVNLILAGRLTDIKNRIRDATPVASSEP